MFIFNKILHNRTVTGCNIHPCLVFPYGQEWTGHVFPVTEVDRSVDRSPSSCLLGQVALLCEGIKIFERFFSEGISDSTVDTNSQR